VDTFGISYTASIAVDMLIAFGGKMQRGELEVSGKKYKHWWVITNDNVEIDPISEYVLEKTGHRVRTEYTSDVFNRDELDSEIICELERNTNPAR